MKREYNVLYYNYGEDCYYVETIYANSLINAVEEFSANHTDEKVSVISVVDKESSIGAPDILGATDYYKDMLEKAEAANDVMNNLVAQWQDKYSRAVLEKNAAERREKRMTGIAEKIANKYVRKCHAIHVILELMGINEAFDYMWALNKDTLEEYINREGRWATEKEDDEEEIDD